jgi:hypothetical protein
MRGAVEEVLGVGDADRHGHPARGVPCVRRARFAAHQASGARPAMMCVKVLAGAPCGKS